MSGSRWCCCPDCVIFADHFDKCDPLLTEAGECPPYYPDCPQTWLLVTGGTCPPTTTGYDPPWSIDPNPPHDCIPTQEHRPAWLPHGNPHSWYWCASTEGQYAGDGALFETSGDGEIWCRAGWDEVGVGSQGYAVMVYTVDEVVKSTYRILLCLETEGDDSGDCLILDFYNGDWLSTPNVDATLSIKVRIGGSETSVKTKTFAPVVPSDPRLGRTILFKYIPDWPVVCVQIQNATLTGYANDICAISSEFDDAGVSIPGGYHAGLGNKSGLDENDDPIPVEFDDFLFYRMRYRGSDGDDLTKPSIVEPECFSCLCMCMDSDPPYRKWALPNHIRLHVWGSCSDPYTHEVLCEIDDWIDLYVMEDCAAGWRSGNSENLGVIDYHGHPCVFTWICPGLGVLEMHDSYDDLTPPDIYWYEGQNIYPLVYTFERTLLECKPYHEKWTLAIGLGSEQRWPGFGGTFKPAECQCRAGGATIYFEAFGA